MDLEGFRPFKDWGKGFLSWIASRHKDGLAVSFAVLCNLDPDASAAIGPVTYSQVNWRHASGFDGIVKFIFGHAGILPF